MVRRIDKTQAPPERKPKGHKLNLNGTHTAAKEPAKNGTHKPKPKSQKVPEPPARILRPVVYLPRELTCIEQVLNPASRFQMIRILFGDEDYRIEATDGRMLAILRGSNRPMPETMRHDIERNLVDAPDGAVEVVIAWAEFLAAFKRCQGDYLGARISSQGLHVADARLGYCIPTYTEGKFPDIQQVIPTFPPLFSVHLDADAVSRLMKMVNALTHGKERKAQFLFYQTNHPVGLYKMTKDGISLDALLMPCTEADK